MDDVIHVGSVKSSDVELGDEIAKENTNEKIKDFFTDNDGNVLDSEEIPFLKAQIGEWKILTAKKDKRKICYAISYPFIKIGNHKEDRDSYLMIVYMNRSKQLLNISTGYPTKRGSKMHISVDGTQYQTSVTNENIIIPHNSQIIVKKMLYGKKILIKASAIIGTYSVDAYDLADFKNVYLKLAELCD